MRDPDGRQKHLRNKSCTFSKYCFWYFLCVAGRERCADPEHLWRRHCPAQVHTFSISLTSIWPITMTRGSVEDTTAYATTNSTGYAESVLGAGIGSNGKVLSLTLSSSCLHIRPNPLSQSWQWCQLWPSKVVMGNSCSHHVGGENQLLTRGHNQPRYQLHLIQKKTFTLFTIQQHQSQSVK